jgi:hypothetical protein
MWLEGLDKFEKSNDLIGNRTTAFLLVAECLNQLRYRVPSAYMGKIRM